MEMKLGLGCIKVFLSQSQGSTEEMLSFLTYSGNWILLGKRRALLILPLDSTYSTQEDVISKTGSHSQQVQYLENFQISIFSESKKMMFLKSSRINRLATFVSPLTTTKKYIEFAES